MSNVLGMLQWDVGPLETVGKSLDRFHCIEVDHPSVCLSLCIETLAAVEELELFEHRGLASLGWAYFLLRLPVFVD